MRHAGQLKLLPLLALLALGATYSGGGSSGPPSAVNSTGQSSLPLDITGSVTANGFQGVPMVGSTPTVAVVGTPGLASYTYTITVNNAGGGEGVAGTSGSTSIGNATLTGSNYNQLTWSVVPGAASYNVYRTAGGATQGRINASPVNGVVFNDTGLTASATFPVSPTLDMSGSIVIPYGTGLSFQSPICSYTLTSTAGGTLAVSSFPVNCGGGGTAFSSPYVFASSLFVDTVFTNGGEPVNLYRGAQIGNSGVGILNHYYATYNLTPGSMNTGTTSSQAETLTGVTVPATGNVGTTCTAAPPSDPLGITVTCSATSADHITFRFTNGTSGTVVAPAGFYGCACDQH